MLNDRRGGCYGSWKGRGRVWTSMVDGIKSVGIAVHGLYQLEIFECFQAERLKGRSRTTR